MVFRWVVSERLELSSVVLMVVGVLAACRPPVASTEGETFVDVDQTESESDGGGVSTPSSKPSQRRAQTEPRGPRQAEQLEVEGHLPAPLLAPTGTPPPGGFPVLVIAHGAGGRGEHHCGFWNEAVGPDWIIACPTGALLDRRQPNGGAYFPDHFRLRAELVALVAALRGRFSQDLTERFRFMGYSQGATMGALAIVGELDVFDELVLIEGG